MYAGTEQAPYIALRASGTELAVGIGRIGATLGLMLGGIVLTPKATTLFATIAMTLHLLGCALPLRIGQGGIGTETGLT